MDNDSNNQFVSFLAKSIQAFCSGHLQYSSYVEVIGHIHLNIDHNVKLDYVLSEEVSKTTSDTDSGVSFSSHSYLSHPPASVSLPSSIETESHTSSHREYCQDPQLASAHLVCPSKTCSAQDTPSDESHTFAVSLDPGLGETPVTSNLMKVSVSLDYNALPILKQESNQDMEPLMPEMGRPAVQENCQPDQNILVNSQQAVTLSQENVQPEVPYQQENIQSVICSRQHNILPTVSSYRQENIQPAIFHSQDSSQPLLCQPAVTQLQPNGQPVMPVVNLQENYQIGAQENHNQQTSHTTTHTQETRQPNMCYLQASHLPSDKEASECGVSRDQHHGVTSLPSDFQSVTADHSCGMGSNSQFESLCLDVTAVKQEVLSDIPDNQDSSNPLSSGQVAEVETADFGGVVIERLGHQIEGTQLIVVREGMQQQQELPFPIMLHAHAGLSAPISVSPDIESVNVIPVPASTPSQSCSSTDLHVTSGTNPDGARKRCSKKKSGNYRGFQPGNKCWQLQARWKKAKVSRKKLHQGASADRTVSSSDKIKMKKKRPSHGLTSPKTVPSKTVKTAKKEKFHRTSESVQKVSSGKAQITKKKKSHPSGALSKSSKSKGPMHSLKKVPWTGQQKRQPRKCCRVCKEKGLFPMSCYFCPRCPQQPGYCRIRNCFTSYHLKMGLRHCMPSASGKTP